jgi:hypothetical protein
MAACVDTCLSVCRLHSGVQQFSKMILGLSLDRFFLVREKQVTVTLRYSSRAVRLFKDFLY